MKRSSISGYEVGQTLYLDIRTYITGWYDEELTFLEDRYDKIYVVVYQVTAVYPRYIKSLLPHLRRVLASEFRTQYA